MTFDALRSAFPQLGFALYALEPLGDVTLEIYTADGAVYSFTSATAEGAIAAAFPADPPVVTKPPASVFD